MIDLIAPEGKIILEHYVQKTQSGMDAIEKAGEPRVGIVYDFGNPKKDDPQLHLKKGQRVCIKKYVSSPLFVVELGMSFIFVDYDDITAIMVETEGEGKGE